jgi:hypothetical protein
MPYYQLVPAGPFRAIRVGYGCTVEAATTGACPYGARTMKNSIKTRGQGSAVTLTFNVPGELADVFDFVVAEDVLPKVLTGYGFLPGVVRTSSNTGPWDTPGRRALSILLMARRPASKSRPTRDPNISVIGPIDTRLPYGILRTRPPDSGGSTLRVGALM